MGRLKMQFFPDDLQYLSYIEVWLPTDATFAATNIATVQAENIICAVAEKYEQEHTAQAGGHRPILKSVTSFVGSGGLRFWMSVSPELQQINYAQLVLETTDKHETHELVGRLQQALSAAVPGTRIDVKQLQTNPVEAPVEVRLAARTDVGTADGENLIRMLRTLASQVEMILRSAPHAARVRDDWGEESFVVGVHIDADRASLAGIANPDVAASSTVAISGMSLTTLREGDKQIPLVGRLRLEERAQLSDLQNLYIYASQNSNKVPLLLISSLKQQMETPRIRRRDHFRTISVRAFPASGSLPSEVLSATEAQLAAFAKTLPPGYAMTIGGERAKQESGFRELTLVLAMSSA